jgi:hypothetical protein
MPFVLLIKAYVEASLSMFQEILASKLFKFHKILICRIINCAPMFYSFQMEQAKIV